MNNRKQHPGLRIEQMWQDRGEGDRKLKAYRIQMLGGLAVKRGELTVERFRTRKTGALLAYLAYHPRRSHPRELLIEMFWPEAALEMGRQSLSMALSALRTVLEPERVADETGLLQIDRHTVGLNSMCFTADVAEFETALDAADRAVTDAESEPFLRSVVALYIGELLPGHYDEWIFPEQQRLAGRYGQALRELAELTERLGATADALEYALRAVGADPLDEATARQAMRLLALSGRTEAAAQLYHELERRLREQWDVELEPETRTLLKAIRSGLLRRVAVPGLAPPLIEHVTETGPSAVVDSHTAPPRARDLEAVGGAMPVGSHFYIERSADALLRQALLRGDGTVLLKGARQVGKTSLLARGMQRARETGCRVAHAHFQMFHEAQLGTVDTFMLCLAQTLAEQLDLDTGPEATWDPARGPNQNLRRWLRREVLGRQEIRLVWGLDEADRLLGRSYCGEVFGLFRSFHDERALDPDAPWARLTTIIAYSTEAHLLIRDPNQSPFNVGTKLALEDFTPDQVADLNARYGAPLRSAGDLARFVALIGGQPYLTQRGLYALSGEGMNLETLTAQASAEDGPYSDHLGRLLSLLRLDAELCAAMQAVLQGAGPISYDAFYRLRAAGLVSGVSPTGASPRCTLYSLYLRERLL
jgi:DNA-binding SARP family transcriptional activator